jgi:hypothetical protein
VASRTHHSAQGNAESGNDDNSGCVHVWLIDPPNGPTSGGTCDLCGEVKQFKNSYEISYWDNSRKHNPGGPGGKAPRRE